jgi:predicted HTH domain antitoxin
MTRTVRVNATMSEELVKRIDAFAASRQEDRSTAIRQLVDLALRELTKHEALGAYRRGRLTLRELARTLGLDYWATQDLLAAEGIAVAQGSVEETSAVLDEVLTSLSRAGTPSRHA